MRKNSNTPPSSKRPADKSSLDVFMEEYASKLEQRVAHERQSYHLMADAMPHIVWTATADGVTDYFNQRWYEFTGLTVEESIGDRGYAKIMHPDDIERTRKVWHKSLATGEPYQMEYRFMNRKTGRYRWFLARALPGRADDGTIIRWFGTHTDIDDIRRTMKRRRELEEITTNLRKQRAQLIALNTAKDEFISLASHQLRTPATGVKQYVGMLLEGYAGDMTDEQQVMLREAYESNERQLKIVDDLLKVAQVDAGRVILSKEPTDIVALVKAVIEEQADTYKSRRQQLTFKHPDKKTLALTDRSRLRMVIENIIDNASKYTPQGKHISVEVVPGKKTISVIVRDSGVGIAEKDMDMLFHKFARIQNPLSNLVGGTGLGLYWAKKIVDLHQGSIEVASQADKGSAFTINVPAFTSAD